MYRMVVMIRKNLLNRYKFVFVFIFALVFYSSCAQTEKARERMKTEPAAALESICKIGDSIKEVTGMIYLTADSQETKGKFPAALKASPGELNMEVIDPIGRPQAKVKVKNGKFWVRVPSKRKTYRGQETWGGIPLRWSPELLLGRFPCPDLEKGKIRWQDEGAALEWVSNDGTGEKYSYTITEENNAPWPSQLRWSISSRGESDQALWVEFRFFKPEESTGSPLKWAAESDKGKVTVLWGDRKIN